ncbi:aldehyde ferredoxin oxidoreductase family protein [Natronobacterium gregoryi]|uniref:Aldehyde ferredoxin oxidoreductase n=2 Tax=Natronobacterium gregoryi TaxID=44930 RepID=L0AEX1_NATGS|nr:aldehyde ferredoxin oxidoreductase family protein [Natronobacterium gregoryi]AFZ71667.1 aldehyde:ferredoxin oxidoreductase [Natronobacterium gregoryi SP2]ELY72760.1 aldehyde:ferredoxin oxidoreductase [Natronobacterium gregoryi SP2]PLK20283.1 aldehyde ferredoxin oxidoreductase [Natronobacterium gregoryi SP2]SFJ24637.1 aldehyde:ferredoxin oxidoreductase [Natronobacterium gregoryi]
MDTIAGFHGRIAIADLGAETVTTRSIPDGWLESHLGGRGLGVRLLLSEQPGGVDPLGPENRLVFATGPLTGYGVSGAGRHWVGARSPLTGSLGESYSGGSFGHLLARSGVDALVVEGQASRPVVLEVTDETLALESADDRWGETTDVVDATLAGEPRRATAAIGPAGEREVHLASIINDSGHAAGGRGLGAVMGSKRLKAVVVGGSDPPPLGEPERFERLQKQFSRQIQANDRLQQWAEYGTTSAVEILHEQGMLPTKHFDGGRFEGAPEIGGEALQESLQVGQRGCRGCQLECKPVVQGECRGVELDEASGPEYETLASFGSLLCNDDLEAIALANQRCNAYGMDTIGVGHVIATAMEAGYVDWGDADAILELVDAVAYRDGIGDVLADGPDAAAEALDVDDPATVKGAPAAMHDPRKKKGMGLSTATSPRGATHMEGFQDSLVERTVETDLPVETGLAADGTDGKPAAVVTFENARSFVNSLVCCSHVVVTVGPDRNFDDLRELVAAAIGRPLPMAEALRIGERNYTLGKLFAAREGFSMEDDRLPKRLQKPLSDDTGGPDLPAASFSETALESMIRAYYDRRGWTRKGVKWETLERLGLTDLVEGLERAVADEEAAARTTPIPRPRERP